MISLLLSCCSDHEAKLKGEQTMTRILISRVEKRKKDIHKKYLTGRRLHAWRGLVESGVRKFHRRSNILLHIYVLYI